MKKGLVVLLAVVMLIAAAGAVPTRADTGTEISLLAVRLLLIEIGKLDEVDTIFNLNKSDAYIDDEGDIIVTLRSRIPYSIFKSTSESISLAANTWTAFNNLHKEYSSAELYLFIETEDEIIYFTSGDYVVDGKTYETTPFPEDI